MSSVFNNGSCSFFIQLISQIGGWDVLRDDSAGFRAETYTTPDNIIDTLVTVSEHSQSILFNSFVGVDDKNSSRNIIYVSSSYLVHTLDVVSQPELNTAPCNIIVLCNVLKSALLLFEFFDSLFNSWVKTKENNRVLKRGKVQGKHIQNQWDITKGLNKRGATGGPRLQAYSSMCVDVCVSWCWDLLIRWKLWGDCLGRNCILVGCFDFV